MTTNAQLQAWRRANPEKVRAQRRRRLAKHREELRSWRKAKPDKVRVHAANYRNKHRAHVRALWRRHYRRHAVRVKARITRYQADSVAALGDYYIRHKLSRSQLPLSMWPAWLVELKRAQLQLLRLCRNATQTTT